MRKYILGSVIGFVFTSLLFIFFLSGAIKYQFAYNYITHQFDGEVDSTTMEESIYTGIVDGLGDEHSNFIGTENSERFEQGLTTSYEGIGIQVSIAEKEPYVTIESVIENGAASEEDIYAGDQIIKVNEEEITAENAADVAQMIKAEPTVKLELYRPSTDEKIVINTAGTSYTTDSVHAKLFTYDDQTNAYIKIDSFIDTTADEFEVALNNAEENGFDKLVIDLRDNPGGELTALTAIADLIVNSDRPYLTTKRDGEAVDSFQSTLETPKEYPIIVLQNENTASAAEILASALQEVNGSTLIGTTTYGKGSVQRIYNVPFTEAIMKITIEHWYTADDEQIDQVGIEPDIELEDESNIVYQIPLSENIEVGNKSVNSYWVKLYLSMLGYDEELSNYEYTEQTAQNIKSFQRENDLEVTGIVDVQTAWELYEASLAVQNVPENDNIVKAAFEKE